MQHTYTVHEYCTERMLRKNKFLRSLEIVSCKLSPENVCEFCSALQVNTTLTSLDLSWNMLDHQSIASLFTLLQQWYHACSHTVIVLKYNDHVEKIFPYGIITMHNSILQNIAGERI